MLAGGTGAPPYVVVDSRFYNDGCYIEWIYPEKSFYQKLPRFLGSEDVCDDVSRSKEKYNGTCSTSQAERGKPFSECFK